MAFSDIPQELQRVVNWCIWRFETLDGALKPTKVPYHPGGKHASSTNPQTWCSFAEAVAAAPASDKGGIGFFFSPEDDYCGIDLDDPFALKPNGDPVNKDPNAVYARQHAIFEAFDTYAELSPSGKGLHLICKAAVPSGRRRDSVEIYSEARFFTMTGNVIAAKPIAPRQELATKLWGEMGTINQNVAQYFGDMHQSQDDEAVYNAAISAKNGQLFERLWNGDWSGYAPNQSGDASSEADFALIDILAFYTQNRQQIERMFLASALGKREKYKRRQLIGYMISKSFDLMPPPVDLSGVQNLVSDALARIPHSAVASALPASSSGPSSAANTGERAEVLTGLPPASKSAASLGSLDLDYWRKNRPPGILNEIIEYYLKSSPLPVYEMALAGALGIFAGIVGRQYNAGSTGLNIYLMLIADTGKGKDAIASGFSRIINAAAGKILPGANPPRHEFEIAKYVRGPAEIASGQALLKYIGAINIPCFCSITGEFGIKLKQITSKNASPADATLKKVMLDLYNRSGAGNTVEPSIYADRQNNTSVIHSPAFSMIGESTGQNFYAALDEDNVTEGLIPRFTIIEYNGPRVDFNFDADTTVPDSLTYKIRDILMAVHTMANTGDVRAIAMDPAAMQMIVELTNYTTKIINSSAPAVQKEIWNRAVQKIWRLAGLLAVAENFIQPTITAPMIEWAQSLIITDINRLGYKFERGEIGERNPVNDQETYIKNQIVKYFSYDNARLPKSVDRNLWQNRVISRAWLMPFIVGSKPFRNLSDPARAYNAAIDNLINNGILRRMTDKDLAPITAKRGFHFVVADGNWLTD